MELDLNGLKDRLDRAKPYVPYLLTALFAILLTAIISRHEMWRDEMQAWLLARDAPTPWSLFSIIKYEGHPSLWHLILWPFAHVSWNPIWMQAAHIAIMTAAVFVLYRYAPFPWPVKLLMSYGYYFAYEWAVISRNYAISVLLLFIICALWKDRWRKPVLLGAAVFLLCHTNVHSIIISILLLVVICVEYAVHALARDNAGTPRRRMAAAACCIILFGLLTGIVQVIPPPDSGHQKWHFNLKRKGMAVTSQSVVRAFLPVPIDQTAFWGTNLFIDGANIIIDKTEGAQAFRIPYNITVILGILIAGCLFFVSRPLLVLPYLAGMAGLIAFFHFKYAAGPRHYGFLFLVFISVAWISYYYPERKCPRPLAAWERFRMPLLGLLLLVHVWGTLIAWRVDWKETFSAGKETALWLKSEYPNLSSLLLAGNLAPQATVVLGYLQAKRMFYPERNDFGSYIIYNRRRWPVDDRALFRRIRRMMDETEKHVLLVSNSAIPGALLPPGCSFLKSFESGTVQDESFNIYFFNNSQAKNHLSNREK